VLVLGDVLLEALFLAPLRLVSSLAGIVYPLYVLLGIACLSGALMGLAGRTIGKALNEAVYPSRVGDGPKEIPRLTMKEGKRRPIVRRTRKKHEG
jgi:hypothetical protein